MVSIVKTDLDRGIEWLPVVSLLNLYEVSSTGGLRGIARTTNDGKSLKARELKGRPHSKTGYLHYGLSIDGKRYTVMAHRLVCEAFHGPAPEGKPNALHRDGNPSNNSPENLYWGDQSDNNLDSVSHGVHPNARKTHCPSGHPYLGNSYLNDRGWRKCKTCVGERDRKRRNEAND